MRTKDFICYDKDPRCGKLRIINLDDDQFEICHIPHKKPIRNIGCVVIKGSEIKKFLE